MRKKKTPFAARVSDPFDGSAQVRLLRMGIIDKNGQLDREVMSAFAGIFAGLFFDDLCDYYDDAEDLLEIYGMFRAFYSKQDYQHMYLLISIQYDSIRKPLPDPVWWLAGNHAAVKEYMTLFMEHYKHFMAEAGFTGQGAEEVGD